MAETTVPRLTIRLLGGFAVHREDRPCEPGYEKGRALLAYVASEPGRPHDRAGLAAMLWPDLDRAAALTNLRQVLSDLRRALNPRNDTEHPLRITRGSVTIEALPGATIDAKNIATPVPDCPEVPDPSYCLACLADMEASVKLYPGEFMAGFSLCDSPDFEDWLQVQREMLHLRVLDRLARLAECHQRNGAYTKALSFALRFLELEPWNEAGLRRAMRLFALNGQRAAALAQYETCCLALKRELDVLPCEETHALAASIRRGELSPVVGAAAQALPASPAPSSIAERRQVTVLYCELLPVGTEDPDEALALLHAPQIRCCEIIRGHSGHLLQVHGGSLLAYFGYPQAHENSARLAVQAALAAMRLGGPGIEMRGGIHTGPVITGDSLAPDVIGATSGLAIRLRQLAGGGEVAISGATRRLVEGYFEFVGLGQLTPPHAARAIDAYKVGRESGARHRLEAAPRLAPFVGRDAEVALMHSLWRDVGGGRRRTLLLRGEAGIGKSRLVLSLADALGDQIGAVRELRCFPEHSHTPFHPLAALYANILEFSSADTPEQKFDKMTAFVGSNYANLGADAVPLLARMLALPLRAPWRESTLAPSALRERLLMIVIDRLYDLAARGPVLLVAEDLHWADPSTLEFLAQVLGQRREAPILTIFTARPEFKPSWDDAQVSTLTLAPLSDAETAQLIASIAPQLPVPTVDRIIERANGVPLFAEELAREVAANELAAIPSSLQDLLAVRLDGVGAAKRVAQSAAAIGREFGIELLRLASPLNGVDLARSLNRLQDAGLVQCQGDGAFQFCHALTRDAAYQSLTRGERESAHRRIAGALKEQGAEARPELLAQHWAACGETREAIACWIEAGKFAARHSAIEEAIAHFRSGLALVERLPGGAEQLRQEFDLQISLGAAMCAMQGYASADGAQAYARAMELCGEGDAEMFQAAWGLWASASSRVGYAGALSLARQLLSMAQATSDPVRKQQGNFAVADTLYWVGEFPAAREFLETVRSLYLPAHHGAHVAGFGEDAGITAGSYLSWVLWFLGYPDQARSVSEQTLERARQLRHPFTLGYALTFAAILNCRLRLPEKALPLAEETLVLAAQHGFALWQIGASLAHGWASSLQGRDEGVEALQQCAEAVRTAMGGVTLVVLEPLAHACQVIGRFDLALSVAQEALAVGSAVGDHHVDAELHRLRGESLLGRGDADLAAVEDCFQQALAISRQQQAKSLELRAAMSLAGLWWKCGKTADARRLLEEACGWFTEGFDTPDLVDARALLASLAIAERPAT